jgi:hypothetical protein
MPLTPAIGLPPLIGRCYKYEVVQSDQLLHKELHAAGTAAPGSQSTCTYQLSVIHISQARVFPSDIYMYSYILYAS